MMAKCLDVNVSNDFLQLLSNQGFATFAFQSSYPDKEE